MLNIPYKRTLIRSAPLLLALIHATLSVLPSHAENSDKFKNISPVLTQDPIVARVLEKTAQEVDKAEKQFYQAALRSYVNYHRMLQGLHRKTQNQEMKSAFENELTRVEQSIAALKASQVKWVPTTRAPGGTEAGVGPEAGEVASKLWREAGVNPKLFKPIITGKTIINGDILPPRWRRRNDFILDDFESGIAIDNMQGMTFSSQAPTALTGKRSVTIRQGGILRLALTKEPDAIQAVGREGTYLSLRFRLPNLEPFDATRHGNALYVRLRRDPGRGNISIVIVNKISNFALGKLVKLNGSGEYLIHFSDKRFAKYAPAFKDILSFGITFHFEGEPALLEIEEWGITRR